MTQKAGTVERWNGGTVELWNGGTVEWRNGGMVEWRKMTPNPKTWDGRK